MDDKKTVRDRMRTQRDGLPEEKITEYSQKIAKTILLSEIYSQYTRICVYQPFRNEVDCQHITERALADGKTVYLPVTDRQSKTIDFYQITENTVYQNGAYGIREPIFDKENRESLRLKDSALILMPGLAFDKKKHRLGYGGGYYDKYLAVHRGNVTMALCYDFQIVEDELPFEEHDILPNYIVTEQRMW